MLSNTPSFLTNSLWTRCPGKRSLISIPKEKSNDNHAPLLCEENVQEESSCFSWSLRYISTSEARQYNQHFWH